MLICHLTRQIYAQFAGATMVNKNTVWFNKILFFNFIEHRNLNKKSTVSIDMVLGCLFNRIVLML